MSQKVKSIQIIHLAIFAGTLLVYIFAGDLSLEKLGQMPKVDFFIAIPIAAIVLSNVLFRSQLKQIDPKADAENKMEIYQAASIIRWAVLEGAAFLILFLRPEYILFGFILIVYLGSLRPTEEKIRVQLAR